MKIRNPEQRTLAEAETNEVPQELKKIHFMVHPGYNPKYASLLRDYWELAEQFGPDECMVLIFEQDYKTLRQLYALRKAEQTTEGIVEACTEPKHYDAIMDWIMELQSMLGKRFFFFTEHTFGKEEEICARFQRELKARNFTFDPQTVESDTGGIYADSCVTGHTGQWNKILGLRKKTIVLLEYTDAKKENLSVEKVIEMTRACMDEGDKTLEYLDFQKIS